MMLRPTPGWPVGFFGNPSPSSRIVRPPVPSLLVQWNHKVPRFTVTNGIVHGLLCDVVKMRCDIEVADENRFIAFESQLI